MLLELHQAGFNLDSTRVDSAQNSLANLSEDLDIILRDNSMPEDPSTRIQLLRVTETSLDLKRSIPGVVRS